MAATAALDGRPEQIYFIGPEDLVADAQTIVAGLVSDYRKEVSRMSETGPNGFPLEWTASGKIQSPISFKGQTGPGPIPFSRPERSFFLSPDPQTPLWQRDFGEISPTGQVVLFSDAGHTVVLPSGNQEQDLIALVKEIATIQAIADSSERGREWLRQITTAHTDEGSRAALRSLAHSGAEWGQLEDSIKTLLSDAGRTSAIKAYAFGFVAYYLVQGKWPKEFDQAVELLCQVYANQRDPRLELQYLQSFKTVLAYAVEEPRQESRQRARKRILQTVEQQAALGAADSTLAEECRRIQAQFGH